MTCPPCSPCPRARSRPGCCASPSSPSCLPTLPGAAHRALRYAGPAVLGAMVVTSLIGPDGLAALAPSARHLALLAAALVAWRVRNLAAPIIAALAVMLVAAAVS
jgi:branched-subunit amino acid transport protein